MSKEGKNAGDVYRDVPVGAPIPIDPDGGIQVGYMAGENEGPPPMTPEHCICLRGPCRHYWEMKTPVDSTAGYGVYNQLAYTCLRNTEEEMNLNDTVVTDCNMWDPFTPRELKKLEKRRSRLRKQYEASAAVEEEEYNDQ